MWSFVCMNVYELLPYLVFVKARRGHWIRLELQFRVVMRHTQMLEWTLWKSRVSEVPSYARKHMFGDSADY